MLPIAGATFFEQGIATAVTHLRWCHSLNDSSRLLSAIAPAIELVAD